MPIETAEERAKRWAEEAALRESAKKQFAEIPNHDEDFEWCLGLRMAVEELTTQESRSGYKHDEKKVSWTLEIPGNSWTASCRTRTFPSMRILHQSWHGEILLQLPDLLIRRHLRDLQPVQELWTNMCRWSVHSPTIENRETGRNPVLTFPWARCNKLLKPYYGGLVLYATPWKMQWPPGILFGTLTIYLFQLLRS